MPVSNTNINSSTEVEPDIPKPEAVDKPMHESSPSKENAKALSIPKEVREALLGYEEGSPSSIQKGHL